MKGLLSWCLMMVTMTLNAQHKFAYKNLSDGTFTPRTVSGVRSMNDGERYTTLEGRSIVRYSYRTGEALDTVFTMPEEMPVPEGYEFSGDEKKLLLVTEKEPVYRHSFRAEHWIYDVETESLRRLSENGKQQAASFSPDGSKAAFVRDNDLFYAELTGEAGREVRVTEDGEFNRIINGVPDWVYEEEYGFAQAYRWAPGSDRIAYYRFDESRVKEYGMTVFGDRLYPSVRTFKYPKAGEENSAVEIYAYDLKGGKRVKMNVGDQTDQYIPRILWTPAGELAICRLNRHQNRFDLLLADPDTGNAKTIYTETDPRYVERIDDETITFLKDGKRFVVKSERDGYMHLYLHDIERGELGPITQGAWDVTALLGVDEGGDEKGGGTVYYLSCETSPLRRNLYSVRLDGTEKKRLTGEEGTYDIVFSKGFKYYIAYFSNVAAPNTVTLHWADGKTVRVLEDNRELKAKMAELNVPVKEFFSFVTSEGTELNGYLVKPVDFDPDRKYPVLMTQYSGPGSQSVADNWKMSWEDVLVQEGYIVACVDGRGTGFRGADFRKCTYKNLGHYEVLDQIEAARYLGTLPYVDAARIGIYGWSYGGFMALNCILKGNDVFKAAVAVAPVTNWRYYDTIYTELYNGLPQENPEGYDHNSPIFFAERLKGKLLIAHGTADDNVHIQNTYEMIDRLVKADKAFETHIYPDRNHGMVPGGRNHLLERCIEFVKNNL